MSPRSRLPLCTLAWVAIALAVDASASVSSRLAFERGPVESGQYWRLLTGHLVHELPSVALVDLGMLVILGAWIEHRSRRLLGAALFASALLSSLALLLMTDYERAIGSSGLVSGLLMAAIVLAFRRCNRTVALVAGALFGSKLALELFGLWPAALGGLPPGYEPAAAAHIGGALGGGMIAAAYRGVDGADSPRGASIQPAEPTSRPPRTTRSGAAP